MVHKFCRYGSELFQHRVGRLHMFCIPIRWFSVYSLNNHLLSDDAVIWINREKLQKYFQILVLIAQRQDIADERVFVPAFELLTKHGLLMHALDQKNFNTGFVFLDKFLSE